MSPLPKGTRQIRLPQFQVQWRGPVQKCALILFSRQLDPTKGLQRRQTLPLALDPTPILGRGTVKEFYNLRLDNSPFLRTLA